MGSRALRPQTQVCHFCDFLITRRTISSNTLRPVRVIARLPQRHSSTRTFTTQDATEAIVRPRSTYTRPSNVSFSHIRQASTSSAVPPNQDVEKAMGEVKYLCDSILGSDGIPSEEHLLIALALCQNVANALIHPQDTRAKNKDGSTASALLDVEEPSAPKTDATSLKKSPAVQKTIDQISQYAYALMIHQSTFISPKVLQQYVELQYTLQKPETLPEIFYLYANKPLPEEGSAPIKYNKQNPDKAANAIPLPVADRALQTAIDTKQLAVAMNLVGTSYATKASRRAKFVRRGLLPATGLAAAPLAAYTIASQFGLYQSTMDPQVATNMAFVGILAYVGFTTTIGVVAVTTANDQMDRVTWATGMPLRERWIREEERAAIDRIAGAWGFRESWRRGEEEGKDWDALREWIGRKGMVLDRSELMEGME